MSRSNPKEHVSDTLKRLHNAMPQLIEKVKGHQSGQLTFEKNDAHTFWDCVSVCTVR